MVSKCNRIASLVILNYKTFIREVSQAPPPYERGGSTPSRPPPPPSCRRHSVNTNGVQWPYHFLKADDGPGVYILRCKRNPTLTKMLVKLLLFDKKTNTHTQLSPIICLSYNIKIRTQWLMFAELQGEI